GLVEALQSPDTMIRSQAADLLGQFGARAQEAVPALLVAVRTSPPPVRVRLVDALSKIDLAKAKEIAAAGLPEMMQTSMGSGPYGIQAAAILYKLDHQNREAARVLREALAHSQSYSRQQAASYLGQVGPEAKDFVPAIRELLQDQTASVRLA